MLEATEIHILLVTNILNYQNVALFICHLFIDGNFRTGHILHDPKVSSDYGINLLIQMEKVYPSSISWLKTDITQQVSLPWAPHETTDHILQLIFLDLDHLPDDINNFKDMFAYYRLCIITSTAKDRVLAVEQLKSILNTDLVILDKIFESAISVYSIPRQRKELPRLIYLQEPGLDFTQVNLFDTLMIRVS